MSIGTLLAYPPPEGKTFEEQLKDIERRYRRYELAMQDLSASHARLKDARLKAKKAKDRSKAEKIEKLRRYSSLLKECSLTVSGEEARGLIGEAIELYKRHLEIDKTLEDVPAQDETYFKDFA